MVWEVEYTDEFGSWFEEQTRSAQKSITSSVLLLEKYGPQLPFPHSSQINGSQYGTMRELRVQIKGEPFRVFYAFDPRRMAILLIGGNKTGDNRFYEKLVPEADLLYAQHIEELKNEGLLP
jgi:hypothetical protein